MLWLDWMSKEHLTPLGGHAYLAIYGAYDAQKNLYNLTLNYLRDRVASIQANTHTVKRNVTKGCSQCSCCGPGLRPLTCWDRGFESHRGAWIFVCCECRVLSGRGLCDELITCPEESYRLWCVVVCDPETSRMRRSWPALGRSATAKKKNEDAWKHEYQQYLNALKVLTKACSLVKCFRYWTGTCNKSNWREYNIWHDASCSVRQELSAQPTQPHIQLIPGALSLWGEVPRGRDADHSPPSVAEVENGRMYTSTHTVAWMTLCLIRNRQLYRYVIFFLPFTVQIISHIIQFTMCFLSLYRSIYKSRHSVCLFWYLSLPWRRRLLLYVYLLATFLPMLCWVSALRTEQLAPGHSLGNVLTLFLTSDPIAPGSLLLNRSQLKPVSLGSPSGRGKTEKLLSSFSVRSLTL